MRGTNVHGLAQRVPGGRGKVTSSSSFLVFFLFGVFLSVALRLTVFLFGSFSAVALPPVWLSSSALALSPTIWLLEMKDPAGDANHAKDPRHLSTA